jgi:hypothetical protein
MRSVGRPALSIKEKKEHQRASLRKWREKNKDYVKEWKRLHPEGMREYRRKLKEKVLRAYGGKCNCCGETIIEFLTIDHKNGGGNKHRRNIHSDFYLWLIKNNFPKDEFQVLCMNCNFATRFGRICPHNKININRNLIDK